MNSNELEITIDEDVSALNNIEVYVNKGWNLPANTIASTDVFQIDADWNSVGIIQDVTTVVATKVF